MMHFHCVDPKGLQLAECHMTNEWENGDGYAPETDRQTPRLKNGDVLLRLTDTEAHTSGYCRVLVSVNFYVQNFVDSCSITNKHIESVVRRLPH